MLELLCVNNSQLVQPRSVTSRAGESMDPSPRKGKRGKGREIGLKMKQQQQSEEKKKLIY